MATAPTGAVLQLNLGNRLLDEGREAEAIRHFEAAIHLRPDEVAPGTNLAWLLETTDDRALPDPQRAIGLSLEATTEAGDDADAPMP